VTRPTQWHCWHPATKEVTNAPDRPLVAGETMCEHISVVWQLFSAVWKVFECTPHSQWVIATAASHGDSKITYDCRAVEGGCEFHRRLEYRSKNWFMRLLDGNLIKWSINRQSTTALANLKALLESGKT
ncbi:MAG: SRPBCC family protein, partial [Casimicrobium sp.]